ncbi:putative reverse transcriptase domain-containing protein, partial [Tanacetum coccineum]
MRTRSAGRACFQNLEGERVYGLVEVEGVEDLGKREPMRSPTLTDQCRNNYRTFLSVLLAHLEIEEMIGNQKVNVDNENEYAGKGGVVVLTRWIEKRESMHDISGCSNDQKVKYTENGGSTSQYYTKAMHISSALTDEEERIGVLSPSVPPATPTMHPEGLVAPASSVTAQVIWKRIVEVAQGLEENHPNQVAANNEGQGRGNQGNQARGRAFMLGAEEARQDPNIVTGTFTLNNHFATTLFDSGADYSFVSTTFIPLLCLEPNELGFKYEIEIASGQLVVIDKVIKGCKLEIEGHVFDIDLIPFGHRSFDVIIGMDWLSNYKAEIICHEKVVRIPLPDGKVLRVVGERQEEKERLLISAKASDKKQEDIFVVRDFPEVFPDDLSGLLPIR